MKCRNQPFPPCNTPPPATALPARLPPAKFRALQLLGRKFEIMFFIEVDRSAEIYVKVAAALMVFLLAYGALTLAGVIR